MEDRPTALISPNLIPSERRAGDGAQTLETLPAQPVTVRPDADEDISATFCFVDIAGYTALTDHHGERAAADLVEDFNQLVRSAVQSHGHIQELSGDNAFLVFADPVLAIKAISALYRMVVERIGFPVLRSGLHHGSALHRGGRYFGSTVNIAARTLAQAGSGQIICTGPVADALASANDAAIAVEHRGLFRLKNLAQAVDLYGVVLLDAPLPLDIDPVCQMQVDRQSAADSAQFAGRTYWFCSAACARRFHDAPSSFVLAERS